MSKPFKLRGPDRYPNSYIGVYLGDPMQIKLLDFMDTKELNIQHDYNLRFEVLTTKDKIFAYDLVQVNTPHRYLFSPKAIAILNELCADQIQVFDTVIECKDGNIMDYKAINILNEVDVSDSEKSVISKVAGYNKFVFKDQQLEPMHIARDAKFHPAIIISATLKEAFEKAKIKGCQYWPGDEGR